MPTIPPPSEKKGKKTGGLLLPRGVLHFRFENPFFLSHIFSEDVWTAGSS